MPNPLDVVDAAGKVVDKVTDAVDDNVYSREEREADITSRHLADMQSDNWLAKSIRPIVTIWALVLNSYIWIGESLGLEINDSIVSAASGVLITVIGFYFAARGAEKVFARRSAASIQIEKMKAREEVRQDRQERRQARRQQRKS